MKKNNIEIISIDNDVEICKGVTQFEYYCGDIPFISFQLNDEYQIYNINSLRNKSLKWFLGRYT